MAVPSAGARHTLDATTLTPDATANPNAFHFGVTDKGVKFTIKPTYTDFGGDEFRSPLTTTVTALEMSIAGAFIAITDLDVIKNVLAGVGTYSTSSGYKQVTIGALAIAFQSVVDIFPLFEDPTKVGVFALYSALNKSGVEWEQGRTTRGATPFSFMGYDVTTRATADTTGNYWKQI
jgi:hypothetical protein